MSDLEQQFNDAVKLVQTIEGDYKPSNDLKLELYSLFKQASEGDVSGKKPGMLDVIGRAKYSAWAELKGLSKADAMQKYVDRIEHLKKTIPQ